MIDSTKTVLLLTALLAAAHSTAASPDGTPIQFGDPVIVGANSTVEGASWALIRPASEDLVLTLSLPAGSTILEETHTFGRVYVDGMAAQTVELLPSNETHTLEEDLEVHVTLPGQGGLFLRGKADVTSHHGTLVSGAAGQCAYDLIDGDPYQVARFADPCLDAPGLLGVFKTAQPSHVVSDRLERISWTGAVTECPDSDWCPVGGQDRTDRVGDGSTAYVETYSTSVVHWTGQAASLEATGEAGSTLLGGDDLDLISKDSTRLPSVITTDCLDCTDPAGQAVTIKGELLLSGIKRSEDGTLSGQTYSPTGIVFFDEVATEWSALQTGAAVAAASAVAASALGLLGVKVIAPLLTKGSQKEMLKHPRRDTVYAYIQENPGTTFRELMRATQIPAGSLRHHVNVLERSDIIVEHDHHATKRFFENHGRYDETWHAIVLLREEPLKKLHDWLDGNPESPQKKILAAFQEQGWSRSTVQNRLKRLEKEGLVSVTPRGRLKTYSTIDPRNTAPDQRSEPAHPWGLTVS